MSSGSYGGRHRGAKHATPKRRRFLTGLALPTAAAAALTFTATGAAVVTSTKTQPVSSLNTTSAAAPLDATVDPSQIRADFLQASQDKALAIARTDSANWVARTAKRKDLAARELAAERKAKAHSWQLPIKNAVRTSDYGWRWGRLHAGEDFGCSIGTDLVSMSTGTVIFAGQESGYGNMIKIGYWDGTVSYFAHMSHLSVTEGENVAPGEVVGQSGNSGHSTGPHLHLEIHPNGGVAIDPAIWLADHKLAY